MLRIALLCLTAFTAMAEDLRDPRPGSWVLDRSGRIPAADARRVDAIADAVQQRGAGQIVAVVVGTTGGADHRRYATDLFNRWRIGATGRDDGVLVFVALDDRRAEIVLGDGVDDDAQVAASQRIYDQTMRPWLREGLPGAALVAGATACATDILGLPADALPGAVARPVDVSAPAPIAPPSSPGPEAEHPRPARAAPTFVDTTPHAPYANYIGPQSPAASPLVWLLVGLAAVGGFFGLRLWLRHRARLCRNCRQPMHRLDEQTDDRWLTEAEQVEERVGSVDYDVWSCDPCNTSEKVRYGRWFTSYSGCPRCHAKTLSRTTRTLRHATEWSGGLEQVDERCAHCQHAHRWERSTPRIVWQRSTGISGGSSFGSRSSGGSSFGGGGGGRSSGRGGGGSW